MEIKYQTSADNFRVKYTLVVPDNQNSGYQVCDEEIKFLQDLDEAWQTDSCNQLSSEFSI